jgi:glucosyl-3-phosphoglycerate synthase
LIEHPGLMLVSGVEQPLPARCAPGGGDRLTELVARPLVARYQPALAGLRQPLLRSFAARRSLLRTVAFPVGDGVRLSLLVDTILRHGRVGWLRSRSVDRHLTNDRYANSAPTPRS